MIANRFFAGVGELWEGRKGVTYTIDGNREYSRFFLVLVKSKFLSPVDVVLCPGLPRFGSFYVTPGSWDTQSKLIKIEASQMDKDDWQRWLVTCTYSTKWQPQTQDPKNPENDPLEISSDFEIEQIAPDSDLDGRAYINSAYMPFTPAPTFPIAYPVMTITRSELNYDFTLASEFAFALNDDDFLDYPIDCVQCLPPKATQAYSGSLAYAKVTYKLKFAPKIGVTTLDNDGFAETNEVFKSFQPRMLDQGTMEWKKLTQFNGDPLPPADPNFGKFDWVKIYIKGSPAASPVLLNGQGGKGPVLSADGVPIPQYRSFRQYKRQSFESLLSRGLGSLGIIEFNQASRAAAAAANAGGP